MTEIFIIIVPFAPCYQAGVDRLLDEIAPEYAESFFHQPVTKMEEVYSLPGRSYWVALAGDDIVGTAGVIISGAYAILKSVFVARAFRGSKLQIANRLVQQATDEAMRSGCRHMYLGTMAQFHAAQRFYEKLGYRRVDEHLLPPSFPRNPIDTVFYKKDLAVSGINDEL